MYLCCISLTHFYYVHFGYLVSTIEHILTYSIFPEIFIIVDFNVHRQLWLSSSITDHAGERTFKFAILGDLNQHHARIPDYLADTPKIIDLFLTTNTSPYFVKLFFKLGSSHHNLTSVFHLAIPVTPLEPPKRTCFCQYTFAQ